MLKTGNKNDDEFLSGWGGSKTEFVQAGGKSGPTADAGTSSATGSAADTGAAQPSLLVSLGLAPSADAASPGPAPAPEHASAKFGSGGGLPILDLSGAGISIPVQVSDFSAGGISLGFPTATPAIDGASAPAAASFDTADYSSDPTPVAAASTTMFAAASPTGFATTSVVLNKIALENLKQGTARSIWALKTDVGDANIQGFATQISTNIGGTVDFKIATTSTNYRLEIYRMGYYGGDGARLVDVVERQLTTAQLQPHPIIDNTIGLVDAGNWSVSASWGFPADAVSGVYFAKLVRQDGTSGENIIPFIVRDDASHSNIVFQTADTTWQAYNPWGGVNLYMGDVPLNPADMIAYMPPTCGCSAGAIGRAYAVSYNRPYVTGTSTNFLLSGPQDYVFSVEFPAIQWLEQNGYDVSYISGVDSARNGSLLLNHDVFLSVGHDEYWSGAQRDNVTAARDAGVNLAFLGGNDMYWKIQWQDSIDGNGTPYRTMVCYKDTWANADINPAQGSTGTWRDPRFADPGQQPENSLIGTMFSVDSWRSDTITIPYDMTQLRFWRNTAIANTPVGGTGQLVDGLLGYEWNSDVDNGYRPAGLINMSLSTVSVDTLLLDYGNSVGSGTATHSLTMYRDQQSGALVFSAGSVFWSWGLNDQHDLEGVPVDPNVQQAMVNLFADMGIQPTTLDASLILATKSTDHVAPTATITSPVAGAAFVEGQRFTITGTAQDTGGRVAGIEVSVDGGLTWRKAAGTTNWSYTWIAQASGTYQIQARATDDSLNIGVASASQQIQVNLPSTSSLWTYANKPVQDTNYERQSVELGLKFTASTPGSVTGIRFYKGAINVGTHTGSLWTAAGTLLATGTFTNESAEGWQTLTFSSAIALQAGQLYVASYHTSGYYSGDEGFFSVAYQSGALSAPVNAGVYLYGDGGTFPGQSVDNNYWVDVIFTPSTSNTAPTANNDAVTAGKNIPLSIAAAQLLGNDTDPDADALKILSVGNATHGTVSFNNTTNIVTFTPDNNYTGPATFTYTVSDSRGGTSSATVNVDVTAGVVGATLFGSSAPAGGPQHEALGLELGVRFTVSADGTITGLRFYKSSQETGTHVGSLWTSTGTLLASATFLNETASGWQTLTFQNAISVTADVTYVASYHSNGSYMADGGYFNTPHVSGPLTAQGGGNGVFSYGTGVPTDSYNNTNYWVDVTYTSTQGGNRRPVATADSLTTTTGSVLTIAISALLANDTDPDGDTLTLTGVSGASHGTVSIDNVAGTVIFTPTAGYFGPAAFNYTISDGNGGTATGSVGIQISPAAGTASLFSASDAPQSATGNDSNSVELGVKFTVSIGGTITGIRYYKGAQDTGTHSGSLWTSTGTLLATATFTNESASGWQTVLFSAPVSVAAGASFVASYHSNGYYLADPGYFATAHTSGPLTAPAGSNGVFAYGGTSAFPGDSYNNTNYWVDVVFVQEATGTNHSPVANADTNLTVTNSTPLSIAIATLLGNDTDPDGDPISLTAVSGAQNGTVSLDAVNNAVIFTPTNGYSGAAGFSYTISDGRGGTASTTVSLQVSQPVTPAQSFFAANDAPANTYSDGVPLQLGMRFQADVAGTITGIKFYKAANENGPHTANLWTSTGTLLGSGTTTSETASGWQIVTLGQGIAISANTDYVVSYGSNGTYGATGNFFSAQLDSGNLHASADVNGLYAYGSGDFPTSSFNKTNYYIDVIFKPLAA